ncbi:MAG: hypothetical protein ACYTFN_17580 [Planctomycetota bacterium]
MPLGQVVLVRLGGVEGVAVQADGLQVVEDLGFHLVLLDRQPLEQRMRPERPAAGLGPEEHQLIELRLLGLRRARGHGPLARQRDDADVVRIEAREQRREVLHGHRGRVLPRQRQRCRDRKQQGQDQEDQVGAHGSNPPV